MFNNNELVEHSDRLKNFAYRLTNNTHNAEDLLHNTIIRAMEKKHLFKEGTNLYSWTSKIMYNLFVSDYRRKVKFETQYDPESFLEKESVDASQDIQMEVKDVDNAMNNLSDDHKEILIMVCAKNMKYADVAKTIGVPVGTVRSRLSRAREALLAEMDTPKSQALIPAHMRNADTAIAA